jgi:hypothetical protein
MLEHTFNINFNIDFNVILALMENNCKTTKFQHITQVKNRAIGSVPYKN